MTLKERILTKPGYRVMFVVAAFLVVGSIEYRTEVAIRDTPIVNPLTAKEQKIAKVLINHGSDNPVELAREIAKAKRPRLATGVAIVESNGRNVRGAMNEKGYFQIREELHREFGDDLKSQVQKFESVMEQMIKESDGNLRKALSRYNGDRTGKYASLVLKRVNEVKL